MKRTAIRGPVDHTPLSKAPMEVKKTISDLRMSGQSQTTLFHPEKGWTPKPLFTRAMVLVIAAMPLIALATFVFIRFFTDAPGEALIAADDGTPSYLSLVLASVAALGGLALLIIGLVSLVRYLDLAGDPYAQGVIISAFFLIFREWGSVVALPWAEILALDREQESGRRKQSIRIEEGTIFVEVRYGDGETWFRQAKAYRTSTKNGTVMVRPGSARQRRSGVDPRR